MNMQVTKSSIIMVLWGGKENRAEYRFAVLSMCSFMDFFADNAPILRLEGLVIAFKDIQKGYWTFSKRHGHSLHCFKPSLECEYDFL